MKRLSLEVHPRPPWLLLVAAALTVAACGPGRQPGPRATPPPPFQTFGAASRAELIAYAHSLQFDTLQPAMDAQYLVVPRARQLAVGPYASVAPEIGAAVTEGAFTRGRIFARLWFKQAGPELGVPAGFAYVWVDSVGGAIRAMLVPENDSFPVVTAKTVATTPACPAGPACCTRAIARFEMPDPPADSLPMITCHPCDHRLCCDQFLLKQTVTSQVTRPQGLGRPGVVKPPARPPVPQKPKP